MTELRATESSSGKFPNSIIKNERLPLWLFVSSLVITYGYAVFSFSLTIDQDSSGALGRYPRFLGSFGEGRWAMSFLTLLLPNPVAPVVSIGIAVAASGVAWWLISRKYLGLTSWQTAVAASLAGTVPTLAFMFSFSTVAFAIGIGNLLVLGFLAGLSSHSWMLRILGLIAGTTAVGIYDTFLLCLVAVAVAYIWKRGTWSSVLFGLGGVGLSFGLSKLAGAIGAKLVHSAVSPYIGNFFDLPGFIEHPVVRAKRAVINVWSTISLSREWFGLSSPWLAVAVILLIIGAVASVFIMSGTVKQHLIRAMALTALVAAPFVAEAIAVAIPLRSMIYLPMIILVLAGMYMGGAPRFRLVRPILRATPQSLVALVIILAVLGNASISNRLFAAAATTYALDRDLAFQIGQEKDALSSGNNLADLPTVVVGLHNWPQGTFTQQRETLGGSLFNLAPTRTVAFLVAHGVLVHLANPDQTSLISSYAQNLPKYPQPGWVSLQDGILVLNFGTNQP